MCGLGELRVRVQRDERNGRDGVWDCPPTLNVHQSALSSMTMQIGGRAGRNLDWDWHLFWWTMVAMGVGGQCRRRASLGALTPYRRSSRPNRSRFLKLFFGGRGRTSASEAVNGAEHTEGLPRVSRGSGPVLHFQHISNNWHIPLPRREPVFRPRAHRDFPPVRPGSPTLSTIRFHRV